MKIKKYKAPTLQEAMKHIRKDLGQDAVILNSKVVYTGGFLGLFQKKNIEVIAGVDDEIDRRKQNRTTPRFEVNEERFEKETSTVNRASKEELDKLINEMKEMKRLIQSMGGSGSQAYPKELRSFEEDLKCREFDDEIRVNVMASLLEAYYLNGKSLSKEKFHQVLKDEVEKVIQPIPFHGMTGTKKYINVIGPTGVGKTTTLAKLAAEMKIKRKKRIAFITTDTYRIAAIEQLKTYANILNAPVEVCYNAEDFMKAKTKLHSYDVVFIDTAGRNFMEEKYVEDLKSVIDFEQDMETFLVFSLTAKYDDMVDIFRQFQAIPIHQFIFTKYDETKAHGAMLNLILKTKIGCGYITNGQDVPDDIEEMSQQKFVQWLLR